MDINLKQLASFFLLTVFVAACKNPVAVKKMTPKEKLESEKNYTTRLTKEFASLIDGEKLKGSILLFDFQKEKYYSNDLEWAKVERLPASTFKIPNTIIALETATLQSDTSRFIWDGKPREMKDWEKNLTLMEAFKVSCVPCYQEVARNIGYDKMKQYLRRFSYGNMIFTKETVDRFWLEGKSVISQYQQIDFIERFYHDGLGISERTTNITKKIMLMEQTENYSFYGKTGTSENKGIINGWFVGFLEVGTKVYFFALNVEPKGNATMESFRNQRIELTKKALKVAGLMN